MNDPVNDPLLARLTELQQRIEALARLGEELVSIIEQYAVLTRALRAGEPPPPAPRVN